MLALMYRQRRCIVCSTRLLAKSSPCTQMRRGGTAACMRRNPLLGCYLGPSVKNELINGFLLRFHLKLCCGPFGWPCISCTRVERPIYAYFWVGSNSDTLATAGQTLAGLSVPCLYGLNAIMITFNILCQATWQIALFFPRLFESWRFWCLVFDFAYVSIWFRI